MAVIKRFLRSNQELLDFYRDVKGEGLQENNLAKAEHYPCIAVLSIDQKGPFDSIAFIYESDFTQVEEKEFEIWSITSHVDESGHLTLYRLIGKETAANFESAVDKYVSKLPEDHRWPFKKIQGKLWTLFNLPLSCCEQDAKKAASILYKQTLE